MRFLAWLLQILLVRRESKRWSETAAAAVEVDGGG